jgi:hypothetical protein
MQLELAVRSAPCCSTVCPKQQRYVRTTQSVYTCAHTQLCSHRTPLDTRNKQDTTKTDKMHICKFIFSFFIFCLLRDSNPSVYLQDVFLHVKHPVSPSEQTIKTEQTNIKTEQTNIQTEQTNIKTTDNH